jgi:hypothetical protein
MLAHKAVHEGHVAAEAAAGQKSHFDVKVIPSVAYTDPEVAWAGITEDEAKAKGIKVEKGHFPWAASGRAVANGRAEGFTKLLFDAETHRIIGGTIVGTHAGDMIGEIALAIEMGATAPTSARRSTRTRPWASRSAWPPKCTKASAPTCRRRASADRRVVDVMKNRGLCPGFFLTRGCYLRRSSEGWSPSLHALRLRHELGPRPSPGRRFWGQQLSHVAPAKAGAQVCMRTSCLSGCMVKSASHVE